MPATAPVANVALATAPVANVALAPIAVLVARRCVERLDALGLKGRKADDEAVAFFAGACAAVELTNPAGCVAADYQTLGRTLAFIVAFRGAFGVRELAATPDPI